MEIIVAKHGGFCFGVSRAINAVEDSITKFDRIYTYGQIIHNPQVVEDFALRGVKAIENLDEISEDSSVVVRSHGVSKNVLERLQDKGINIINATCPYVLHIQQTVADHYAKGYKIFIVGEKDHPEVMGINGWCDNTAVILDNAGQVNDLSEYDGPCCVVAQTGTMHDSWDEIVDALKLKYPNLEVFNTICNATAIRQKEAAELASKVDVMIVIGGRNSFNTGKLYEICKKFCERTFAVESINDLSTVDIIPNEKLGITAGASTPKRLIKEVISIMSEIEKTETKSNWLEEYEEQKRIHPGSIVTGEIVALNQNEMFLNIGYKSDALLPADQLALKNGEKITEIYKLGQKVTAEVVKLNDGEGNVLLSNKSIAVNSSWEKLETAFQEGKEFSAKCTEVVKGGIIANLDGIRIFVPATQASLGFVNDLKEFVGKDLRLKIIEIDRSRRKLVASQKVVLKEEADKVKKSVLETLNAGDTVKGVVKRFTVFGAFIDLGGIDGMIHVTDMAWFRVHKPQDVLQVGQEIECVILAIDKEKERISLGYKQLQSQPWDNILEKYPIGSVITGKVARIVTFGAFIALEPGVDGLVHVSQLSDKWIKNATEVLQVGQDISAKVIDINTEQKRISLSIKALTEDAESGTEAPESETEAPATADDEAAV